jgi:creatinine amidohydrolase/Fe(II)-dependent formamide hydrolase-like protein
VIEWHAKLSQGEAMGGEVHQYEELTATRLADLGREHTLALMALGPLEVHGSHPPVGTDVLVARELQQRVIERIREWWPETDFLILPTLFAVAGTPIQTHGEVVPCPCTISSAKCPKSNCTSTSKAASVLPRC